MEEELSRYGILKVRLPLPFKLDHVNCYVFPGGDGWVIVDTGLNYPATRRVWTEFMKVHGIGPGDVAGIYITHHHPDHYGAAGWLQEVSGAPVYMDRTEASQAARVWDDAMSDALAAMFLENGMPAQDLPSLLVQVAELRSRTRPHPTVTLLDGGTAVPLGGRPFQVLTTPGHTDGHTCFYDGERGLLLGGDHLLPRISSNISRWPYSHPDPLGDFLASLAENRRLRVNWVLPGHGGCFTGVPERAAELEAHHRERLELMRRVASRGATAYQVAGEVFGDGLSLHETRFALTETIAHLVYLEIRGRLKKCMVNGKWVYSGAQ